MTRFIKSQLKAGLILGSWPTADLIRVRSRNKVSQPKLDKFRTGIAEVYQKPTYYESDISTIVRAFWQTY